MMPAEGTHIAYRTVISACPVVISEASVWDVFGKAETQGRIASGAESVVGTLRHFAARRKLGRYRFMAAIDQAATIEFDL